MVLVFELILRLLKENHLDKLSHIHQYCQEFRFHQEIVVIDIFLLYEIFDVIFLCIQYQSKNNFECSQKL